MCSLFTSLLSVFGIKHRRKVFILDESFEKIKVLQSKLKSIDESISIDHFVNTVDLLASIQKFKSGSNRYEVGIIDHTINGENVELLSVLIKQIDPAIKIIINSRRDSDTMIIKRIIKADTICNKSTDSIVDVVKKQLES